MIIALRNAVCANDDQTFLNIAGKRAGGPCRLGLEYGIASARLTVNPMQMPFESCRRSCSSTCSWHGEEHGRCVAPSFNLAPKLEQTQL